MVAWTSRIESTSMNPPDDTPKLRMAASESAEELAHRLEREERAAQLQREEDLSESLAPLRVGSVPYLNAVPLTRGLEEQVIFVPPSKLQSKLTVTLYSPPGFVVVS